MLTNPITVVARDLPDEASTLALGSAVAAALRPGVVIYCSGELGAGKTTFTRGLLRGLGHQGRVKSPTYTLVELYVISKLNLYHFDFYRFNDPEEWNETGFRELFNPTNVCVVEWPEKAGTLIPPPDLWVKLAIQQTNSQPSRTATLEAYSPAGIALLPQP